MRRTKILFLLSCYLLGGLSSAWGWPRVDFEASERQRWREERMQDKRHAERERRDAKQEQHPHRQDDTERSDRSERQRLSPEERRELRRQIRRANQD